MNFKDEKERKRIQKIVDVFMVGDIRFVPIPVLGDTQFKMLISEIINNLSLISDGVDIDIN